MFKNLLNSHVGYVIVANPINPERLESCGLKSVSDEYFSIVTQKELLLHIPYSRILNIVENNQGGGVNIKTGVLGNSQARLVIHIEHMIIYKGATSFGFQVPI